MKTFQLKTGQKYLGLALVLGTLAIGATSATNARAFVNPLIQTCHAKGGVFEVLNPGVTEDLPMCAFDSASIGAVALKSHDSGESAESVSAFLSSTASDPSSTCSANGAVEVTGTTRDTGQAYQLCRFSDGSLIDLETLARGAADPANARLAAAL